MLEWHGSQKHFFKHLQHPAASSSLNMLKLRLTQGSFATLPLSHRWHGKERWSHRGAAKPLTLPHLREGTARGAMQCTDSADLITIRFEECKVRCFNHFISESSFRNSWLLCCWCWGETGPTWKKHEKRIKKSGKLTPADQHCHPAHGGGGLGGIGCSGDRLTVKSLIELQLVFH